MQFQFTSEREGEKKTAMKDMKKNRGAQKHRPVHRSRRHEDYGETRIPTINCNVQLSVIHGSKNKSGQTLACAAGIDQEVRSLPQNKPRTRDAAEAL
jgi:hypothetical protein